MKLSTGLCAVSNCIATALLAACNGSQPPIGAPGAMQQSQSIATHATHGRGWMLPEAKSDDLLYASDSAASTVYVFSYPRGHLVGTLTGFYEPSGMCVDNSGDVWITNPSPSELIEYSHGGTQPIATLADAAGIPLGCSVDPTTGNLAVTNDAPGNVAIYQNAKGSPATYADQDFLDYWYPAYDGQGNLFVDGSGNYKGQLAELAKGDTNLRTLTINGSIVPRSLQWDGKYLDAADAQGGSRGPQYVDQLKVSGSSATIIGMLKLRSRSNRKLTTAVQFWVQGGTIIGPARPSKDRASLIEFWRYPAGGAPFKTLKPPYAHELWGVTVSLAPRRSIRSNDDEELAF
jgi:hypothetical protein